MLSLPKIRKGLNDWQELESYIAEHSQAEFSHGICPECAEKYAQPKLETPNSH